MKVSLSPRAAFSLIELLMVVGVIALLAVLTVQAVGSVGGGNRLTTAGNELVDVINHARQVARARNTVTLLAVVSDGDEAGRVFGAFSFRATNGAAGDWSQIDRWKTLPAGTVIDLAGSTNLFGAPPASIAFQRGGKTLTCLSTAFLPDGRPRVGGAVPPVLWVRPENASTNNFYKIIINPATGTPIVRRP